ncbi:hypothetical protein JG687_00016382 [Phytophthora cactorum]|uniref:Uncharacterized protein n=3 Tax=Phytophthora cactorum TaxID=29920 RepID=A0A8T1TTH2_9STRA|nr:hypothetical protein JG687_00016382 [Phytophthora cactorum]
MWSELIYVVEMELAKVPAKLVNAWGVAEQQSTVATTLVVVDTLLWLVSLGKVAETTAKAVAVTVTSPLVWKFLFLVVMTLRLGTPVMVDPSGSPTPYDFTHITSTSATAGMEVMTTRTTKSEAVSTPTNGPAHIMPAFVVTAMALVAPHAEMFTVTNTQAGPTITSVTTFVVTTSPFLATACEILAVLMNDGDKG